MKMLCASASMVHWLLLLCSNIVTSASSTVYTFQVEARQVCEESVQELAVNLSSSRHELDTRYLSVAMSPKRVGNSYGSQRLLNLAGALAPADIRVGGTAANFVTFLPPSSSCQARVPAADLEEESYTITGPEWQSFNSFLAKVNYSLLFDLNNFKLNKDRSWDTSNAEELLKFSAAKGIRIPYLQIGNEPNAYYHKYNFEITDKTLVGDYRTLRKLLDKYPTYRDTKLYGPDVTNVGVSRRSREYLEGFFTNGAYDVVSEGSIHFYYVDGDTATISDFLSLQVMNSLRTTLEVAVRTTSSTPRPLPVRLTETASAYGGGASGLSDGYAGGFLWLDQLGLCAKYGVTRLFRQTLIGGAYGLLDNALNPRPDYFLSLVFKRLIQGPVLEASLKMDNENLRVYANCARRDTYAPGALVVYYINVANKDAVLSLTQFPKADLDLYLLTPGGNNGPLSSSVKLNGVTLQLTGDSLPPLTPQSHRGDVTVPGQTFGFIVVPGAKVTVCINYYRKLDLHGQQE